MNLSTQLRIILLLAGVFIWLGIYWWGRRKSEVQRPIVADHEPASPVTDSSALFETTDPLIEDELDTPAYMRRNAIREPRQDYEPRIADADEFADIDELEEPAAHIVSSELSAVHTHDAAAFDVGMTSIRMSEDIQVEPIYIEPEAIHGEPMDEPQDDFAIAASPTSVPTMREPAITRTPVNIPVMAEPVAAGQQSYARERSAPAMMAAPTLSQVVEHSPPRTAKPETSAKPTAAAPRKIIALRLPMTTRVPGAQLLSLLLGEQLQHGKFNIFHRMHATYNENPGTVFSVASMVEPGSFDLAQMPEQQVPGVTMFMLLPGPLDGLIAYDQMLSCAQRLAHATGAELHDERGAKLTAQTMERLREEVLDFQHLIGGTASTH